MNNESLTGTLVLVQPDPDHDTGKNNGLIGVLTYARSEAENYVRFPEGGEAFYPAGQIMMLRDREQISAGLSNSGTSMPLDDFKAMYKIMMLQERGTSQAIYSALAIAKDTPGIQAGVLESISPAQKQELSKTHTR